MSNKKITMRLIQEKVEETNKLVESIKTKNIESIEEELSKLDLSKWEYIPRMEYLEQLLKVARKVDTNYEILSLIVEKWLGNLENGDFDGLIGDLCGIICISIDSIVYVMQGCEDISQEEILSIHLQTSENMFNFALTATRLEEATSKYGEILLEEGEYGEEEIKYNCTLQNDAWWRLLDIAKQKNRKDAISFINLKLNKNIEYAETPEYMKSECKKVVEVNSLNIRDEAQKITNNLFERKEHLDEEILSQVNSMIKEFTELDCVNIVSFFEKDKNYIDDPDILEGPLNSIIYKNSADGNLSLHECLGAPSSRKSKGCRMLTCICINEDDEGDLPVVQLQWFREKCDECKKGIRKPCYAFRLALDAGGWVGCYCSSKCAMTDANKHIKQGLKGEDDFEHFSRFNEIEAYVLHKGILDRNDLYENETDACFYSKKVE